MSESEKRPDGDRNRNGGGITGVGLEFAGILGITAFLGYLADGYFMTKPILMIVGIAIGFFYGIWYLFKKTREIPPYTPSSAEPKNDSERLEDVQTGMDQIGKKIDRIADMKRREGGRGNGGDDERG